MYTYIAFVDFIYKMQIQIAKKGRREPKSAKKPLKLKKIRAFSKKIA